MNKKNSAGFTLIEVLVALAILGFVLSASLKIFSSNAQVVSALEKRTLASGKEETIVIEVDGIRVPKGCEIIETKLVVAEKKESASDFSDTIRFTAPENMVKELLPRQLSQYFLLDGEFMEYFWKKTKNRVSPTQTFPSLISIKFLFFG